MAVSLTDPACVDLRATIIGTLNYKHARNCTKLEESTGGPWCHAHVDETRLDVGVICPKHMLAGFSLKHQATALIPSHG